MSLFKSSETVSAANLHDKILLWAPPHAGKTHTALGWPSPLLVDVETRGAHFADRFKFLVAECRTIAEIAEAFKEIQKGQLPCETIVVDSATAIYYKFVEQYTELNDKGKPVTDWVAVNRRMLACMNFVFGIGGKNVIFTAHAGEKLVRQGRDFTKAGLQFVGDQKFRFAFDYIFRLEPTGQDPRSSPALFHVEKSASPNLKIGDRIKGLDYAKFIEITRGTPAQKIAEAAPLRGEALADAQATGQMPLSGPTLEQHLTAIARIVADKGFAGADIARVVRDATSGKTTDYTKIKVPSEAAEVFERLAKAPARKAS